jgi:hypothetical protein
MQKCACAGGGMTTDLNLFPAVAVFLCSEDRHGSDHEDEKIIKKRQILVKSIMGTPANLVSNSLSFVV